MTPLVKLQIIVVIIYVFSCNLVCIVEFSDQFDI